MPVAHTEPYGLEHRALKQRPHPWLAQQKGQEEYAHAGVEGEYVGKRHQGTALAPELLAHFVGHQMRLLLQQAAQLLEAGSLLLLCASVFNIEEETSWTPTQGKIEFPNPKRTWKKYVDAQRLEVSCGEAP